MFSADPRDRVWLTGPAAAALFASSLIGFAAARPDDYAHATKAVSELGAVGAPLALAFNLFGFILPGVLIVLFACGFLRKGAARTGPVLLALSGASLALAGFAQVDMDDPGALTSVLHALGATGAGVFWVAALFWVAPLLRDRFGLRAWGQATPWFGLFALANIAWQAAFRATELVMPGWGQRIAFFGFFLWFAVTGLLAWRHASSGRGGAAPG